MIYLATSYQGSEFLIYADVENPDSIIFVNYFSWSNRTWECTGLKVKSFKDIKHIARTYLVDEDFASIKKYKPNYEDESSILKDIRKETVWRNNKEEER